MWGTEPCAAISNYRSRVSKALVWAQFPPGTADPVMSASIYPAQTLHSLNTVSIE